MKGGRTRREEGHEDREDTKGGHVIDPNHLSLLPLMTNCPPQWLALYGYLLKNSWIFVGGSLPEHTNLLQLHHSVSSDASQLLEKRAENNTML